MGIKQLYNDNLRKLPNEYGDVSVMAARTRDPCVVFKTDACAYFLGLVITQYIF